MERHYMLKEGEVLKFAKESSYMIHEKQYDELYEEQYYGYYKLVTKDMDDRSFCFTLIDYIFYRGGETKNNVYQPEEKFPYMKTSDILTGIVFPRNWSKGHYEESVLHAVIDPSNNKVAYVITRNEFRNFNRIIQYGVITLENMKLNSVFLNGTKLDERAFGCGNFETTKNMISLVSEEFVDELIRPRNFEECAKW